MREHAMIVGKGMLGKGIAAAVAAVLFSAAGATASGNSVRAGKYGQTVHGAEGVRIESKFYGVIEKLPRDLVGVWVVSGREITVTKDTSIKEKSGRVRVGAQIEVEGRNDIKSFIAHEVEVDDRKFHGTVESLPKNIVGVWIVNGRAITVTRDTYVKEKGGRIQVGSHVEIEGIPDGTQFTATRIKSKPLQR